MRLDVNEELAGNSVSNGDGMHASAGKRRLRTESNPTMVKASKEELFTIGRVDESHVRLSELSGARRRD